jgi:hypothetical protein
MRLMIFNVKSYRPYAPFLVIHGMMLCQMNDAAGLRRC